MDSFIYIGDIYKQMQADSLAQLTGNSTSILTGVINASIEEAKSYLKGKYEIDSSFNPISQHDKTKQYNANKTVYLNATPYSPTATYAVGVQVLQSEKVYNCKTAILTPEAFNVSKWDFLGNQYDIFNAIQPYLLFDYEKVYKKGDVVFWENKTYTAQLPTQIIDHQSALNLGVQLSSPIVNVFPDDTIKGIEYWGTGTNYFVPANTVITNSNYWTAGDNRDQKLLQVCIDITLYHLHCRIAPRNIPELRVVRYMGEPADRINQKQRIIYPVYSALGWLQNVRNGEDITPEMGEIQPKTGNRILFGSNMKNTNSF
jgi:hypothetical protein